MSEQPKLTWHTPMIQVVPEDPYPKGGTCAGANEAGHVTDSVAHWIPPNDCMSDTSKNFAYFGVMDTTTHAFLMGPGS